MNKMQTESWTFGPWNNGLMTATKGNNKRVQESIHGPVRNPDVVSRNRAAQRRKRAAMRG